jgi:hypothetical protein
VEVTVGCSVRRRKFMANNLLHVRRKTMSMLFVELWTCCTYFALVNSEFFHCDECCFVAMKRMFEFSVKISWQTP